MHLLRSSTVFSTSPKRHFLSAISIALSLFHQTRQVQMLDK